MGKIKKAFDNIWKVKMLSKDLKEKDKKIFYEMFLDGYTCAVIDLEGVK